MKLNVKAILFIVLLVAVIWGNIPPSENLLPVVHQVWPDADRLEAITGEVQMVYDKQSQLLGSFNMATETGYGGPIKVAVFVDLEGKILLVSLLHQTETPSFLERMENRHFFSQFQGKHVADPIKLGHDIDAVTTCTVSSTAIAMAANRAAHNNANILLGYGIPDAPNPVQWRYWHSMLLALWGGVFYASWKRLPRWRYGALGTAIVIIGIKLNGCLNLGSLGSVLVGRMPSITTNLTFYITFVAVVISLLILRKNLYCYWICPFGAIQEFIGKITGIQYKLAPAYDTWLRSIPLALAWAALVYALINRKPSLASYEPFAVLFNLDGSFFEWGLLVISFTGALVIPRFWCVLLCPVGAALNWMLKLRLQAGKAWAVSDTKTERVG